MISTTYGEISEDKLVEFCKVAGHELKDGEWKVLSDEVEYWQLVAPGSMVEDRKWKKLRGDLTIRDFNFEYCYYKSNCDVNLALKKAKDTMFDVAGDPIYLPEALYPNGDKKPLKGYSKILVEVKEDYYSANQD